MAVSFGENLLSVFDIWDDAHDFLRGLIESGTVPHGEIRWLLSQSLLAADEDWHYLLDCARSIRQSRHRDPYGLQGVDILTYVCQIFNEFDRNRASLPEAWGNTDRLICLAEGLANDPLIRPPSFPTLKVDGVGVELGLPGAKRILRARTTSHFWSDATQESSRQTAPAVLTTPLRRSLWYQKADATNAPYSLSRSSRSHQPSLAQQQLLRRNPLGCGHSNDCSNSDERSLAVKPQRLTFSPYFSTPSATPIKTSQQRTPAGAVSCVPFPPLSSSYFGIVQEQLAHEPLWLLVAVTFLIKTKGRLAIPVFYEVKKRFPTASELADPANAQELSDMIRHLGLAVVRVVYIQKYAKAFLDQPPRPDVRHRVGNYDRRVVGLSHDGPQGFSDTPDPHFEMPDNDDGDPEAWEIGHMTKGKYAIDSWRIFCRDELLGRAQDWNGKGREP